MKKFAAVLSALMLAVVMVGCSGGSVNLDREVSADGVSWKVPGNWVESTKDYPILNETGYSYSNGRELTADDYEGYAYIAVGTKTDQTAEEAMEHNRDLRSSSEYFVSDEWKELSSSVKDGAQVTTYEDTYKAIGDNDEETTSTTYVGYVIKPGTVTWELTVYTDKTTFDAIMDSVKVS